MTTLENARVSYTTATPLAFVAVMILALSPADAQSPALTVAGEVETPLSLSLEDLRTMGRQRAQVDVQGRRATYEGVPLSEILRRAGIIIGRASLRGKALTSVVVVGAPDGFQAVFALAELDPVLPDNRVIVADTRDGSPRSDDEGPLRVVAPGDKYPARWSRHAIRLTLASVNSSKR